MSDTADGAALASLSEAVVLLSTRPGDVVVLRVPLGTSDRDKAQLHRRLEAVLPEGVQPVLLPEGQPLEVVRPDA